jgi:tRNA(Ile)-lysidine synthase
MCARAPEIPSETPRLAAAASILDRFLREHFAQAPACLGVALSGGADSTALLLAARAWARNAAATIVAVHVDHGLDPGSRERAEGAEAMARQLGLPCTTARIHIVRRRRESWEEAARRMRYESLATLASQTSAGAVLTAHHLDDQVETLLIRMRQGSGLFGLAGIRESWRGFLRPFLSLRRGDLLAIVEEAGIEPLRDPSNENLGFVRNWVRHRVLPRLLQESPGLAQSLAGVADAARGALPVLERLALRPDLAVDLESELGRLMLRRRALAEGRPDPGRKALSELRRQIALGRPAPRATGRGAQEIVADPTPRGCGTNPPRAFSYSVTVPGVVDLPELGSRLGISRSDWQPWMQEGRRDRAALCLGNEVVSATVRNRRPGDRLRPLGAAGEKRLKEVLIDRKVPAGERDRLPLLCLDGKIAWVPGVTVHDDFRLRPGASIWVASLQALTPQASTTTEEDT